MKKGIDYTGVTICYFCHDGQGNFLMNFRSKNCRDEHERWDIGAGGLEFRDGVEDTLRKEIREEYCTEVLDFEFLGVRELHREHEGKPTHWIALDYKVRVDPSTVANGEPHKFDKIGWFTLDNLPSPTHSQFPKFLEKNRAVLSRKSDEYFFNLKLTRQAYWQILQLKERMGAPDLSHVLRHSLAVYDQFLEKTDNGAKIIIQNKQGGQTVVTVDDLLK